MSNDYFNSPAMPRSYAITQQPPTDLLDMYSSNGSSNNIVNSGAMSNSYGSGTLDSESSSSLNPFSYPPPNYPNDFTSKLSLPPYSQNNSNNSDPSCNYPPPERTTNSFAADMLLPNSDHYTQPSKPESHPPMYSNPMSPPTFGAQTNLAQSQQVQLQPQPQAQIQTPNISQPSNAGALVLANNLSTSQQSNDSPSFTSPPPNTGSLAQMIEQMQGKFDFVIKRLEGVESRLSSLEMVTKEIMATQKTMQVQQRRLQDAVEVKPPVFDDSPKRPTLPPMTTTTTTSSSSSSSSMAPYYPPPVSAYPSSTIPSAYYSTPPPSMISSMSNMSLVPVTQTNSHTDSTKADAELAKRLQAEFDEEQRSQSKQGPSKPAPQPSVTSKPAQTEQCPLCAARVPAADIEAHVEQHFEDDSSKSGRPANNADKKDAGKPGLFAKWFAKEEEKKAAESASSTSKSSNSVIAPVQHQPSSNNGGSGSGNAGTTLAHTPSQQQQQMYPASYIAQRNYYPQMPQGQLGRGMPYYGYPMQQPPQQQLLAQQQQRQQQQQQQQALAQQQQYLYYPNLDQQPQ